MISIISFCFYYFFSFVKNKKKGKKRGKMKQSENEKIKKKCVVGSLFARAFYYDGLYNQGARVCGHICLLCILLFLGNIAKCGYAGLDPFLKLLGVFEPCTSTLFLFASFVLLSGYHTWCWYSRTYYFIHVETTFC